VVILGKDYLLSIFDKKRGLDFFSRMKTKRLVVFASKQIQSEIVFPKENLTFIPVSGIGDRNKKLKKFLKP